MPKDTSAVAAKYYQAYTALVLSKKDTPLDKQLAKRVKRPIRLVEHMKPADRVHFVRERTVRVIRRNDALSDTAWVHAKAKHVDGDNYVETVPAMTRDEVDAASATLPFAEAFDDTHKQWLWNALFHYKTPEAAIRATGVSCDYMHLCNVCPHKQTDRAAVQNLAL